MNNALLVYKPRKRLRKKPNTEKLEPLVAKQLVQKWQNDAAKCFVEADLFLRWRNSTHDDRQAALQATWAVVFSHTSEKYRVQQPPEHHSSTEPLPSCSISSLSSPCFDVTKSKNWCDQGAHELAQDCTGAPRASVNRKVIWVLRLRKAPPAEVMPQMTVSKPLVAIPPLTSSLESDAVEPAMGWKQRSRFSIEVNLAATAECMAFLMTAQGKVDLKRELRRMKENEKLAKKQMHVAAHSVVKKDDLETMAIRHSFEAFDTDGSEMDTDGSGAIDFDEFAAWWKTGLTAGKAKTQMILLRLKLRGQSMVKRITGGKATGTALVPEIVPDNYLACS
ncbi:hypothetical protein DYB32_001149 [Aphanomyces invadans]|uniref:EF-hand domain-containing protein n=1 Tax=Aphanomyces invadans TaxID=157072 RepID=A0A3R6VSL0_9STRA|nr:hypothetical protein DYB32_001149 [Aphanomyces invadans]